MLKETASQTAGPFLHIGMAPAAAGITAWDPGPMDVLAGPKAKGERITIEGAVYDGQGALVSDAAIEIWQADAAGLYDHPNDQRNGVRDPDFSNWGRAVASFESGDWRFETVKPGSVPGRDGAAQAPHVALSIFARGINLHLVTRIYFEDEADANASDQILSSIDDAPRRETLIATRSDSDGATTYRFDIRIQGEDETVFFDV